MHKITIIYLLYLPKINYCKISIDFFILCDIIITVKLLTEEQYI